MVRLLEAVEALSVVASPSTRLDSSVRTRVNADLDHAGLDGNRGFKSIGQGLAAIGDVLSKHGLEWDDTLNANSFHGESGQRTIHIALTNEADSFSPTSITNSLVRIAWYQHQSGNYEVTAYLS